MNPETVVLALLRLRGVGPAAIRALPVEALGAANARDLMERLKTVPTGRNATNLGDIDTAWEKAQMDLERCADLGVVCMSYASAAFPVTLRSIPKAPVVLFVYGDASALHRPSLAVVGTRDPSPFGSKAAHRIAASIAADDVGVVSGLAEGCDTAAHLGCLSVKGATIAVLAHGLGSIYPRSNTRLAERIAAEGGCLIAEYPPGIPPMPGNFVSRDRLQSGLSRGVVVVETDVVGGTMHTVRFAQEQRRLLAAVDHPAKWRSLRQSRGNQRLILEGAAVPLSDAVSLKQFVQVALEFRPDREGIARTNDALGDLGLAI